MRYLLEQFVPHVYRFALRLTGDPHEAEDLTQDVMLRAWRNARRLRKPAAGRVWLLRITVNLWNDKLRQRRRQPRRDVILASDQLCDQDPSPIAAAVHKEELKRAMMALEALPPRQRDVLYLHICEDLALKEIGEVLGISYGAVKASLFAGRKRLRTEFKDRYSKADGSTSSK